MAIDPVTGFITGMPNAAGQYVIGICVEEWRDGVLLSTSNRDFQFNVTVCDPNISSLVANQTGDQLCIGETIEFQQYSINATFFLWDFGVPGIASDTSNLESPSYTFPEPGIYDVMLVANPGWPCADTSFSIYEVFEPVEPELVITGFDCPSGTPVYDFGTVDDYPDASFQWEFGALASSGISDLEVNFSWTPTTSLSNPNIFNPVATPSLTTEYVVQAASADGCTSADTVVVNVSPTQFSISNDTTICIGDTVQISASGGNQYLWLPNSDISDVTVSDPLVSPSASQTYVVEVEDADGCEFLDSILVSVQPLPTAFAGFDQGVCAGSDAQLNASGGQIYLWTPTAGLSNANISNPVVTFSSDTATYTVLVTDNTGCENTDTVTVWQEPLPDAQAGPDTTICEGETVQLTSSGGQTYEWSPTAGLNNPNSQNPTATPLTTTTYTVTVGQPSGNLVFNGDFSQGNVGFNSDYTYYPISPGNMGEARYSTVTNANSIHAAFQGTGHTGNAPLDSFMVVNGAGSPNQNVWCQTVSVSPNTDYFFGAWVSTVVANNPAILQFSINGQVLGSPFMLSCRRPSFCPR